MTLGAALGVAGYPRLSAARPDFAAELTRLEAASGGRLGVSVDDTATGQRYGHRASERFPMCSTAKVLGCGAVLARVDAGHDDLNRRIRFNAKDLVTYSPVTKNRLGAPGMTLAELCQAALTVSDNTAANLIVASLGGPSAVTAFARSLGDKMTRLDRIETALNEAQPGDVRDTTTPAAMAANLQALVTGGILSPRSRDQLAAWLVANQTGGAKLRAGLPADWRVGDKTGSGGFGTSNDIAVIYPPDRKPLIVCVYLTDTKAGPDNSDKTIAAVARTVRDLVPA
ncbi:class A beta-lactamase [Rhodopila sp.]|uniref:class A beta-lactamase n=1 Tax=Rhodopila sp. TaxID=2480087 RepID=UPI003D11CE2A